MHLFYCYVTHMSKYLLIFCLQSEGKKATCTDKIILKLIAVYLFFSNTPNAATLIGKLMCFILQRDIPYYILHTILLSVSFVRHYLICHIKICSFLIVKVLHSNWILKEISFFELDFSSLQFLMLVYIYIILLLHNIFQVTYIFGILRLKTYSFS